MTQLGSRSIPRFLFIIALAALGNGCDASHSGGGGGGGGENAAGSASRAGDGARSKDPSFRVYLEGDAIMLEARPGTKRWLGYRTCTGAFSVSKRGADGWVPLQDDRFPSENNPGHYFDGTYIKESHSLGCDVLACIEFQPDTQVGLALEYVKTGTKAPPPGTDTMLSEVDVVETRAFHGDVRVEIRFSEDEQCTKTKSASLTLTVPEHGVCCPIGLAQCSSEGPGGGWAPDLDSCPSWSTTYDAYYREETDERGCPVLREDDSVCCGCPVDAGI